MLKSTDTQLLSIKELAWRLNRHPNYVYRMKKAGFPMPGYRSTVEAALQWLEDNPGWSRTLDQAKKRATKKLPRRSP
jgi:hypothetical protein